MGSQKMLLEVPTA